MEGGILHQLRNMSREDRRTFDGWLKANVAAGFLLFSALLGMALAGSDRARTDQAATDGSTTPPVAGASVAAEPRADESAPALYPGRYSTNCQPGPIVGCVCETNTGLASVFPELVTSGQGSAAVPADSEYSRMVQWLRSTCQAVTTPR